MYSIGHGTLILMLLSLVYASSIQIGHQVSCPTSTCACGDNTISAILNNAIAQTQTHFLLQTVSVGAPVDCNAYCSNIAHDFNIGCDTRAYALCYGACIGFDHTACYNCIQDTPYSGIFCGNDIGVSQYLLCLFNTCLSKSEQCQQIGGQLCSDDSCCVNGLCCPGGGCCDSICCTDGTCCCAIEVCMPIPNSPLNTCYDALC